MQSIPLPAPYVLVQTRHGWMVTNTCDHYIGCALVEYGEYGELEWNTLSSLFLRPGCIVEVGANMGTLSVPLAKKAASEGRAFFAFEPQPVIFQTLCANLALSGLLNARAFPYACGSHASTVRVPVIDYLIPNSNFGGVSVSAEQTTAFPSIDVPCVTLDEQLAGEQVALIKIDVEGFEGEVLRGAEKIIRESRPIIYTENDRDDKSAALLSQLFALGYDIYWDLAPLFNPNNFAARQDNLYGGTISINVVCVPSELNITVLGATRITSPTDSWQSVVATWQAKT